MGPPSAPVGRGGGRVAGGGRAHSATPKRSPGGRRVRPGPRPPLPLLPPQRPLPSPPLLLLPTTVCVRPTAILPHEPRGEAGVGEGGQDIRNIVLIHFVYYLTTYFLLPAPYSWCLLPTTYTYYVVLTTYPLLPPTLVLLPLLLSLLLLLLLLLLPMLLLLQW